MLGKIRNRLVGAYFFWVAIWLLVFLKFSDGGIWDFLAKFGIKRENTPALLLLIVFAPLVIYIFILLLKGIVGKLRKVSPTRAYGAPPIKKGRYGYTWSRPLKEVGAIIIILYIAWFLVVVTIAGFHYQKLVKFYTAEPTPEAPWVPGLESAWDSKEFRSEFSNLALIVAGCTGVPLFILIPVIATALQKEKGYPGSAGRNGTFPPL